MKYPVLMAIGLAFVAYAFQGLLKTAKKPAAFQPVEPAKVDDAAKHPDPA